MKISTETLPARRVQLEIEVDDERHNQALDKAFKRLAPRTRVPGFRPGKAPRNLVEKQLGHHRLLDEAMEILLPEVYREAIESEDLDPIANPEVELVSHEPFVFKATVPLRPVIDLGDYKSLRVERPPVSVSDEEVEEQLTVLRQRHGTLEPVDRAAQMEDIIRGNLKVESDGNEVYNADEIEYRLNENALASLPGLAEAVVGMKKGDSKTVEAAVPADHENTQIAGKPVTYHIVVSEVKEEKLADLDDAFAQQVGEGFENVAALRERIRADLLKSAEDAALHQVHEAGLEALMGIATLEYPEVLAEREVDRILEEEANLDPRDPRAQELYIARLGKSEEEVRAQVREAAESRLRRSLVLSQLADTENIEVTDDDVEQELQEMGLSAGAQSAGIMQVFGSESGREMIKRSILSRRTLERLVEIVAPAEAAAETEEAKAAPAPKRRRSGPRQAE